MYFLSFAIWATPFIDESVILCGAFQIGAAKIQPQWRENAAKISRSTYKIEQHKNPGPYRQSFPVSVTRGAIPSTPFTDYSLKELLQELNVRNIRFPVNATRLDLEELLMKNNAGKENTFMSENNHISSTAPLSVILDDLNRHHIRFTPNATRKELEDLWKDNVNLSNNQKASQDEALKLNSVHTEELQVNEQDFILQSDVMPSINDNKTIPCLLETLDPMRKDSNYNLNSSTLNLNAVNSSNDESKKSYHEMKLRSMRRKRRRNANPRTGKSFSALTKAFLTSSSILSTSKHRRHITNESEKPKGIRSLRRVSGATSIVANKAKRWKRSFLEYMTLEDGTVKNVEWYYNTYAPDSGKKKASIRSGDDNTIDVFPTPFTSKSTEIERQQSLNETISPALVVDSKVISNPSFIRKSSTGSKPYRLMPSDDNASNHCQDSAEDMRRRGSGDKVRNRRIYNPYESTIADSQDEMNKFFDKTFSNVRETVANGRNESMPPNPDVENNSFQGNRNNAAGRSKEQHHGRHRTSVRKSQARFWKDRLEEQIDLFLGIHDNDSTYTNWENEVGEERKHSSMKKSKQENRPKKPVKRSSKVPLWEEEGSLVSLLFGRRPNGGQLKLEKFLDQEIGGTHLLTNMISTVFKAGLLIASYLCRWASVKGAIPQPVVVMAVMSTTVSARPGVRIRMVAFTLLILRTIGEVIHGYVNGNQDWEDCNLYEFDKEKEEM